MQAAVQVCFKLLKWRYGYVILIFVPAFIVSLGSGEMPSIGELAARRNMKYKVIEAMCICLFTGVLVCVAAISQPVSANENINTDMTVEGSVGEYGQRSDEGLAEEAVQRTAYFQAGIQEYLSSLGTGAYLSDEEEFPETAQEESEYADLAIADVTNYVNVRSEPNTDGAIVGKIYDGAVAQILSVAGEEKDWFHVVSGNVEGYIKSEFFLYGDAAVAVIDDYVTRYATVLADRLNVREQPDIESSRVGYIDNGEKVKLLDNLGDWLKVQYTDRSIGYVSAQYVTVSEEFIYAKTLEEEAKELAEKRALEERRRISEAQAAENTTVAPPNITYSSNGELRQQIVDYAMQYLGYKYVHGGQTLSGGTDCSGFTSLIYKEFGYSVSRTPAGQLSDSGRSISYSEIQPGDIICYGSGKCTHVALYIGDGQIIHAANSRKGVIIGQADYDNILGVKNIID